MYDDTRSPGVWALPPDPLPDESVTFPKKVQYDPQPGAYDTTGAEWTLAENRYGFPVEQNEDGRS